MSTPLQQSIARQRDSLFNMLLDPLHRAATRLAKVWDDRAATDEKLLALLVEIPYVRFLYCTGPDGVQISANAGSREGLVEADFGRDRSHRPYMRQLDPARETCLSEAYISLRASRPSVTAVQQIRRDGVLIGYLGADFDLRDLPLTRELYEEPGGWRQMRGDAAIRGQVFHQCRIDSLLDGHLDQVIPVLEELVTESGVFHVKVHFSSSRATLWFVDDPYRYRILEFDALVDADICLAYPHRPYPPDALVPASAIRPILDTFRHLRFADQTIYLRAGSVNVFNGIVSLNFSCDGSHYIPYDQFLAHDSAFWEGIG